ncbi:MULTISPECIES: DUF6233 domain-containing protein [Streptomyces]|uniref:DUF6233 domain-containing protein n=2 Tax=Streptomyces TaxID=1883 RepID=A0ABV9IM97_9ACTN
MSELSPAERLAKLRTLEEWLAWQLDQTRRKIGDVERRLQQEEQGGYISEQAIHNDHPAGVTIHRADCTMIERPVTSLTAEKACWSLSNDKSFFHPCQFCAPGKALGLDG